MQTLNTKIQKTLKDCKFEIAKTRKGTDYKIFEITDNEAFWELWKADKESVKALGYVVFKKDKFSGEYYLRDMSKMEYDCSKKVSKARSLENLEKAHEVKQANDDARKALKSKTVAKKVAAPTKKSEKAMSQAEIIKFAEAVKYLESKGFTVTEK